MFEALALELLVADRDDLVDDEDLGADVHRDREAEPHVHADRVDLHRRVDELLDSGEVDDLVELAVDLLAGHAEDRGVQVDVLPAREVRVEPRAQLQQRRDAAGDLHPALVGPVDPGDAAQERRLARSVVADERVHRPLGESRATRRRAPRNGWRPGRGRVAVKNSLTEVGRSACRRNRLETTLDDDRMTHGQISSMKPGARLANTHHPTATDHRRGTDHRDPVHQGGHLQEVDRAPHSPDEVGHRVELEQRPRQRVLLDDGLASRRSAWRRTATGDRVPSGSRHRGTAR